jgi:RNA polymerase-interacting CarD/CdnL/TRCF family regulator
MGRVVIEPKRFKKGDRVYLRKAGVAHVSGYSGPLGEAPVPVKVKDAASYLLEVEEGGRAQVAFEQAEHLLRPLIDAEEARTILKVLRAKEPGGDLSKLKVTAVIERSTRISEEGTPSEQAQFLRDLYAIEAPLTESQELSIITYERLVLPEVALALDQPLEKIRDELRGRYPALSQRLATNQRLFQHRSRL